VSKTLSPNRQFHRLGLFDASPTRLVIIGCATNVNIANNSCRSIRKCALMVSSVCSESTVVVQNIRSNIPVMNSHDGFSVSIV